MPQEQLVYARNIRFFEAEGEKPESEYLSEKRLYEGDKEIRHEIFDPKGRVLELMEFEYDEKGRLIQEKSTDHTVDAVERIVVEYLGEGHRRETKYYGDEAGETTEIRQNEQGDVISEILADDDGVMEERTVEWHKPGMPLIRKAVDGAGDLLKEERFTYDAEDKITGIEVFDLQAMPDRFRIEIGYDGDVTTERTLSPDGQLFEEVIITKNEADRTEVRDINGAYVVSIQRDAAGNELRRSVTASGLLIRQDEASYDDQGRLATRNDFQYDPVEGRKKRTLRRYAYSG